MELTIKDIEKMASLLENDGVPLAHGTDVSCGLDQLHDLDGGRIPEAQLFENIRFVYSTHTNLTRDDMSRYSDEYEETEWDFEVNPSGYGVDSASYGRGLGVTTGFLMSDALRNKDRPKSICRFVDYLRSKGERVYECGPAHVNRNTGNTIQHWLWLPQGVEVVEEKKSKVVKKKR